MVREPVVSFSRWAPWAERNEIKNAHLPGVYLLAKWDASPPAQVDSQSAQIVYIGEIADSSLMGRWQQFNRSAFEGKPGHTGGMIYNETFGDEGERLYVAAYAPEGLSRGMRAPFIRYTGQRLVWEWARRWGHAPTCNVR